MILGRRDLRKTRVLVAEIGNNHEGNPDAAARLVRAAAQAGADGVKVQIIRPERLVHPSQKERLAQLRRFCLPMPVFVGLARQARRHGMFFAASVFDEESLQEIAPHLDAVKIASGDLTHLSLIGRAAALGKPMLLSTGMADRKEIRAAVRMVSSQWPRRAKPWRDSVALLHCVSLYPTPLSEARLNRIPALRRSFGLTVGYSDHTLGLEAAAAAIALGARVIEKHFTLDKKQSAFRDHALSADPPELKRLAEILHASDGMMGDGRLDPTEAQRRGIRANRRGIYAARNLAAGTRLQEADLALLRPCRGLPASQAPRLIGRFLRRSRKAGEPIGAADLRK